MSEELGNDIKYSIRNPAVFMRHERIEKSSEEIVRIFAVGYSGVLEGGEIKLSERHTELKWLDPLTFNPEEYFEGGWLKGIKEYIDLKKKEKSKSFF